MSVCLSLCVTVYLRYGGQIHKALKQPQLSIYVSVHPPARPSVRQPTYLQMRNGIVQAVERFARCPGIGGSSLVRAFKSSIASFFHGALDP